MSFYDTAYAEIGRMEGVTVRDTQPLSIILDTGKYEFHVTFPEGDSVLLTRIEEHNQSERPIIYLPRIPQEITTRGKTLTEFVANLRLHAHDVFTTFKKHTLE